VPAPATNGIPPSSRATVRDAPAADTNIDEQALGYLMVKHNTNGNSAKTYLAFDLTGQNADRNLPATLALIRFSVSGPQHLQLWALDQPYPSMNNDITWNTAQANDTNSNSMLTSGSFTASPITELIVTASGPGTNILAIPAPWGQFIHSNNLVLALTGMDDPVNTTTGYRIAVTNAGQMPAFGFAQFNGSPPMTATQPASDVTINSAQLNGAVNPRDLGTACYFEYGLTTNYGSCSATNTLAGGTNTLAVTSALAGLMAASRYHYRVVASNSAGLGFGQDVSFSTLAVPLPHLATPTVLSNGAFQFGFDNPYDMEFTVLATADLTAPAALWLALGAPAPIGDGLYQFTDPGATNYPQRFYFLRSP
jgi:hypothetical protein